MFCGSNELKHGESTIAIKDLLGSLVTLVKGKDLLPRNDPFYTEALYFLEGMSDESSEVK